jgi:predicted NUDIX family NTP pyrophosphohydrolase
LGKEGCGRLVNPKGEFDPEEDAWTAARREFEEELGRKVLAEAFIELSPVKSKSSKIVQSFCGRGRF